jgi:hypothetical protein
MKDLENISEQEISKNKSTEYYLAVVESHSVGPQAEGLSAEEIYMAINDLRTEYLTSEDPESGDELRVPFLVDVSCAQWVNEEFFQKEMDERPLFYCALPQAYLSKLKAEDVRDKIENIRAQKGHFSVLYDFPEEINPFFTKDIDEIDDLVTPEGTPAAIFHYHATIEPDEKGLRGFQAPVNISLLNEDEINNNYDQLWKIYVQQFQKLVDHHPIAGALPYGVLKESLLDPTTILMAHKDQAGDIRSFGYYVEDIHKCGWINAEYYQGQNDILYMPGIATDPSYSSPVGSIIMSSLLSKALKEHGVFKLTFECSNKSCKYIPKIVQRMFDRSGLAKPINLKEYRHYYKLAKF